MSDCLCVCVEVELADFCLHDRKTRCTFTVQILLYACLCVRFKFGLLGDGTAAAPNQYGIRLLSDGNMVRGGVYSGNDLDGIRVVSAANNSIVNNRIGKNAAGMVALPNGRDGVELWAVPLPPTPRQHAMTPTPRAIAVQKPNRSHK